MFDLVDILKNDTSQVIEESKLTSVLFHQTKECQLLVEEAFRFENIVPPVMVNNSDETIRQHVRESSIEIVIVEQNLSNNVTEDMKRISHLLPNHASVIVIGSEDAISTIRNLKAMGFYYVFWPITKQELIDFIINVNENRNRNSGLGKNRKAKKVGVWGTKGGVGTSVISAEVAFELTQNHNSSCVLVDHHFHGGNLDIYLGIKDHVKRTVTPGELTNSLDFSYANNMAYKVSPMLSLLAIDSDDLNEFELKDYARTLSDVLAIEYNFIIEDLSCSSSCYVDLQYSAAECDIIVFVIEPTISSLRESTRMVNKLESMQSTARCIFVVNYTMHDKSATASQAEIEKYLRSKVDVLCPYESRLGRMVLDGKHLYQQNLPISKSIKKLTALLLGKKIEKSKNNLLNRLLRKG